MSNASSVTNDTKRSTPSSLAAAMLASDLVNPPRLSVSPLEEPEDYNDIGIPVVLLWLPYTTLSLVLVGLMVVSFIRFHFKHGHKYRRRREQFWRELNVQDILRDAPSDRPRPPRPTDRIDRLIHGTNTQPQVAWKESVQGGGDIYRVTEHPPLPHGGTTTTTDSRSSAAARQQMSTLDARRRPKMSLAEAESSLRFRRSLLDHFRSSVCSRKRTRSRLPVAFSSNLNGSMVNIRCGEKESLSTFHTSRGLDAVSNPGPRQPNRDGHAQRKPDIWTVQGGYKPKLLSTVSGTFGSVNSAVAGDDVTLLTQTVL